MQLKELQPHRYTHGYAVRAHHHTPRARWHKAIATPYLKVTWLLFWVELDFTWITVHFMLIARVCVFIWAYFIVCWRGCDVRDTNGKTNCSLADADHYVHHFRADRQWQLHAILHTSQLLWTKADYLTAAVFLLHCVRSWSLQIIKIWLTCSENLCNLHHKYF